MLKILSLGFQLVEVFFRIFEFVYHDTFLGCVDEGVDN